MTGIVEAVIEELEPEDPFEGLVIDYQATLSSKALIFGKLRWDTAGNT